MIDVNGNPNLLDYVKVYDNALDPNFCNELVAEFEQDLIHQMSTGQDDPVVVTKKNEKLYKKFTEIDFTIVPYWREKYGARLRSEIAEYVKLYFNDLGYPNHLRPGKFGYEGFRIKRYLPDTNERIDEHIDAGNLGFCKRFLSMFWYLNDVEEGGETHFTDLNYYVKPKAGSLLIFPPMWMFPHAGTPVVSGPKYLLHSYLHFALPDKVTNFNILSDLYPQKSGAVKPDDINKQ